MSQLAFLAPTEGTRARRPGEQIALSTRWSMERQAKTIEARLIWYTESPAPTELEVVSSKTLVRPGQPPDLTGEKEISFLLPSGPFSYEGRLFSVRWAIEMVIDGRPTGARFEFDLGPDGSPVTPPT
jgi:hypothetical protein